MTVTRVCVTGLGIASFIAFVGAYIYHRKKKELIPWTWEEVGKIKQLHLYPLKSGHRVELQKAECTDVGLRQTQDEEKVFQMRDSYLIKRRLNLCKHWFNAHLHHPAFKGDSWTSASVIQFEHKFSEIDIFIGSYWPIVHHTVRVGTCFLLEKGENRKIVRRTKAISCLNGILRSLIVYAEKDKEFRTARTYPKLVLIDVSVYDEDHLAVDAPTMRTLYVKIPSKDDKNQTSVKVHGGEEVYAIDCGDEAALWLSRYILEKDSGLRLGYHDASRRRNINAHKNLLEYYKNLTSNAMGLYSDLSAVLLVNQSSVNDLVKRIGNSTVTVDNFRPNVVVDGPNLEPYCEDNWDWIKIGDVIFRNVKDCTRCVMTTINPESGVRSNDREPLKTLEKYRLSNGPNTLPVMGINLEVKIPGVIKVGDAVFISKAKT